MERVKDWKCTFDNQPAILAEIAQKRGLEFPRAFTLWEPMSEAAKAYKEISGSAFCKLPFCHTVEAEALGGAVKFGEGTSGPRTREYICATLDGLLELLPVDYSAGRIQEVLRACRSLKEQGECVMLKVAGPFTILNGLIEIETIYRALRREPEKMKQVFHKLEGELLRYIREAAASGADAISYADAPGGADILGTKGAIRAAEDFTYPFLKKAEHSAGAGLILLCPKTTCALDKIGKVKYNHVRLSKPMTYGEALREVMGKVRFAGQMCINKEAYILKNQQIETMELL